MRIAAAYEPESGTIFQHFGRTEFFKLYEVEDNQIVSSQVISSNGTGHGALAGLLAAMTDESIQLLSPGRASMVTDVWIDFAGVVTGITIYRLLSRRKITR